MSGEPEAGGPAASRRIAETRQAGGLSLRCRIVDHSVMVWMPTPAGDETLAARAALARAVREDPAAAGLPLVPDDAGFDPSVAVGANVYVDPLDDESGGGVFVGWTAHFVLQSAAVEALSEGREDDPSIQLAGTATKDANHMAPFHLLVKERHPGPSWRDWLDGQTARLQKNLMTTARNSPATDQDSKPGRDAARQRRHEAVPQLPRRPAGRLQPDPAGDEPERTPQSDAR